MGDCSQRDELTMYSEINRLRQRAFLFVRWDEMTIGPATGSIQFSGIWNATS